MAFMLFLYGNRIINGNGLFCAFFPSELPGAFESFFRKALAEFWRFADFHEPVGYGSDIGRIYHDASVSCDFRKTGNRTRKHWRSVRHGFENRESETFV